MAKYATRMGDGFRVEMTEDDMRRDIEQGTQDAARRGKINALSDDHLKYLLEIFKSPDRSVLLSIMPKSHC
ncbi:hypothetical protein ES708_09963 [subsurface metagenome]